jgi:hypothetical protein
MQRQLFVMLVIGPLCASSAAQEKPDFTGAWLMDATRSESAAQSAEASPRLPVKLIIVQTPNRLNVQTDVDGRRQSVTYLFETPEQSRPVGTSGSNQTRLEPLRVEWNGSTLVTTTIYHINGMATTKIERRTLEPGGRELTVETVVQVEHGYQSNENSRPGYNVVKDIYTRLGSP